jgi:ATP-binding protein involved in chromosome partitioning
MNLTEDHIKNALKNVKYPGFTRDIVSFGIVKNVEIEDSNVKISLVLPKPDGELEENIKQAVKKTVLELPGVNGLEINSESRPPKTPAGQAKPDEPKEKKISNIKYFIAVASGKGGVGKSTVAVNLALAASKLRKNVGLMDADIWGPSTPIMMGTNDKPTTNDRKKLNPIEKFGINLMSIGFLINEDDTVIWRGPMVHSAIKQFLEDVDWKETEYLFVDLPPGTGDSQLSLIQSAPITGGIIVTTPQDVALLDVKRGVQMFRKLNVPVLGIVENMSHLNCPHCSKEIDVFSRGGGYKMAEKFDIPFLGEIPIDPEIRKGGDYGNPIVLSQPGSEVSKSFTTIAEEILNKIEQN